MENTIETKPKRNYWKIFGIVVIVILVLAGLYFGYNYITTQAYNEGAKDGMTYLANYQTATGNVSYIENQTIKTINIKDICEGLK